jgi:DnaJ-class molecular chaperone
VIDYYVVLGVPRDESAAGIRAAFRGLAKRHHPDRAGGADTLRFREVAEAYGALSDDARRRRHDAALASEAARVPIGPSWPEASRAWPASEPLAAARPFGERVSIASAFGAIDPPLEELLARLARTATGIGRPKGGRVDEVHVELLLSADEAAHGGAIDVGVPVPHWCAACAGTGHGAYGPCQTCRGDGTVEREALVRVRIPRVRRDASVDVPLAHLGLDDVVLRLHVRIAPWRAL